ncbi:biotin transporter BioY [Thermococcus peptonophilus]|uniref:Biotin transporter BioY n=1 Tax=Thermococcus peptonophilus TaxID=53952 RepID=A0A142CT07_9EURY|nr:biotin transporter BioY [Thermococcus peptonophilus]AMQ17909.1 biotin transporter BioY [Thermococcus peptonophilus]
MNAREVAYAGIFIAFMAVSAQISVSLGPVPLTFQVFAVLLTGLLLGPRLGLLSVLSYDIAGAVGLPVFAGFSGGITHLYGPTGGYLLAFPIAAFLAGYITEKSRESVLGMAIGSLAGITVIYLLGWLRLGLFMGGDFEKAFQLGVLLFVPLDILKAAIAVGIAKTVRRMIEVG